MDYAPFIEKKKSRFAELETAMAKDDFYADPKVAASLSQEYTHIKNLLATWEEFSDASRHLADNRELEAGEDEEMAALAAEEIPELEKRYEKLEMELLYALLPRD